MYFISIVFLALLSFTNCQRFVDDSCTQTSGSPGICTLFNNCPDAVKGTQEFPKRFPQICGFQGSQPIVCCPLVQQRKPGEISHQKCDEYSEYVWVNRTSPVSIIGAPVIRRNECGHKEVTLILGGTPAKRKEFPHMAAIGYEELSGELSWKCGGTLISEQFVLTAAHCLYDDRNNLPASHVRMGVTDLKESRRRRDFKVGQLIPHPDYNISSYYNDIGLIKLTEPAELNPYIIPACLYPKHEITAQRAIATGWGITETGNPSDKLLKVTLELVDHDTCNAQYRTLSTRKLSMGIVDKIQICAGSTEMKDACPGDSGGPLQVYHIGDDIKCMYDVMGITSFGKGCGSRTGGYVRVSNYIKWIEDIVWP